MLWIVLPLFEDGALEGALKEFRDQRPRPTPQPAEGGPLGWKRFFEICCGILLALRFMATRNPPVLHRDLKPANILMKGGQPQLSDFGLSTNAAHAVTMAGTQRYMSLEQHDGRDQTPATDIYSFGCVAWELLQAPREPRDNVKSLMHLVEDLTKSVPLDMSGIPQDLTFIAGCFQSEPAKRPGHSELLRKFNDAARSRLTDWMEIRDEDDGIVGKAMADIRKLSVEQLQAVCANGGKCPVSLLPVSATRRSTLPLDFSCLALTAGEWMACHADGINAWTRMQDRIKELCTVRHGFRITCPGSAGSSKTSRIVSVSTGGGGGGAPIVVHISRKLRADAVYDLLSQLRYEVLVSLCTNRGVWRDVATQVSYHCETLLLSDSAWAACVAGPMEKDAIVAKMTELAFQRDEMVLFDVVARLKLTAAPDITADMIASLVLESAVKSNDDQLMCQSVFMSEQDFEHLQDVLDCISSNGVFTVGYHCCSAADNGGATFDPRQLECPDIIALSKATVAGYRALQENHQYLSFMTEHSLPATEPCCVVVSRAAAGGSNEQRDDEGDASNLGERHMNIDPEFFFGQPYALGRTVSLAVLDLPPKTEQQLAEDPDHCCTACSLRMIEFFQADDPLLHIGNQSDHILPITDENASDIQPNVRCIWGFNAASPYPIAHYRGLHVMAVEVPAAEGHEPSIMYYAAYVAKQ